MHIKQVEARPLAAAIIVGIVVVVLMAVCAVRYWSSHYYATDPKHPVTSAVNYDDVPPATQVPAENANQVFWGYMQQHKCIRSHVDLSIWYDCDNGRWVEDDFLKVVEGNFPYKGGVK